MDLKLSATQAKLNEDVRAWIASEFPFEGRAEWAGSGRFRDGLAANGWLEAVLPDPADLGESSIRAAMVAEAAGAAVICDPFFRATYAAAAIVMECGQQDSFGSMREAIRAGQRFALAILEPGRGFSLTPREAVVEPAGQGWTLSGRKAAVVDGAAADSLLVTADLGGETALFLVASEKLEKTPYRTIDGLHAADITFSAAPGELIARGRDAEQALAAGLHQTFTALGAEALGACDTAIADTAAYAGRRQQFGRPIARFQVIAHRLARMFIEADTLRGGVINALSVADADSVSRVAAARGVKFLIGESGRYVVQQAIQVHGGVGVLEDRRAAHCYKLLTSIDAYFGQAQEHLGRYADALG